MTLDAELVERFWAKVRKADGDGCWEWTGAGRAAGYGGFSMPNGASVYAHRLSWEIANGPIPKRDGYHGTVVGHRCDNPACVRPDHLFIGSQADNIRDRDRKGRTATGSKIWSAEAKRRQRLNGDGPMTCRHGHEMVGDNVRLSKDKQGRVSRVCIACDRRNALAYYHRKHPPKNAP